MLPVTLNNDYNLLNKALRGGPFDTQGGGFVNFRNKLSGFHLLQNKLSGFHVVRNKLSGPRRQQILWPDLSL